MTAAGFLRWATVAVGLAWAVGSSSTGAQSGPPAHAGALSIQITSPLGRTGMSGPVRIVARIASAPTAVLSKVTFYVDGKLIGEDADGPPYALEWVDENPFEARQIQVQVADSLGNSARDTVELKPLEIVQSTWVSAVLVDSLVTDKLGRSVKGLSAGDFHLSEDGVAQTVDQAIPDPIPATYTLLVDSSQSMSRRIDFVRDAAHELPRFLRPADDVMVVPFSKSLGPVTGPTKDMETIAGAIDAISSKGGTAILDCLASLAKQLKAVPSRHVIVLITDGYDENSQLTYERALDAIKASNVTVYVVAIGGVAGISLKGEDLLRRIATETGGKAFFPWRDFELAQDHAKIAADVQDRYLITYTPTNQKLDGTWRAIALKTSNPDYKILARSGYYAPAPPPIRPQIELTIKDLNRQYLDVTAGDLVVLEDGVEQQIEGFEEALTPVSIVLVLDSSGSMRTDAPRVMDAARRFVQAIPKKDSLAVMQFADKPILVQDFSTNRESSLAAIDQYEAKGGTALYDAMGESLARLKRVDTRRVVVVLTDGRDEDNAGTGPGSVRSFDNVITNLDEVGATVYAIGLGSRVDRPRLERLAEVSGGEAYFPEDVSLLDADYRRILEDMRRRYVILYTSTNSAHDGGWRKIEIRAKRPGVMIQTKGGYFAPRDEK